MTASKPVIFPRTNQMYLPCTLLPRPMGTLGLCFLTSLVFLSLLFTSLPLTSNHHGGQTGQIKETPFLTKGPGEEIDSDRGNDGFVSWLGIVGLSGALP